MAAFSQEREVVRARTAYLAAAHRLAAAMSEYYATGVPMGPAAHGATLPVWTPRQVLIVVNIRNAWIEVANAKRTYDGLAREFGEA